MKNKIVKLLKNIYYRKLSKNIEKDKNVWVFAEWSGKRCIDNSAYLANYVANSNLISTIWITNRNVNTEILDNKIKIVYKDTKEAIQILKKARVVVVSSGIADVCTDEIKYFNGAFYVNLWHGVPWKKIFFDSNKNKNVFNNILYIFRYKYFSSDLYLSLSEKFSNILINSLFIKENRIINAGYPRNNIFYSKSKVDSCREKIIKSLGLDKKDKIISYLPTFRDKNSNSFDFSLLNNSKLVNILNMHNAVIIQKKHFVNSEQPFEGDNSKYIINLESNYSSQELLAASDMLITDYSSCFFDYLLLDRPIIHYLYDYDYYKNEDRGLYYSKEEVACGDCPETIDELLNAIEDNLNNPNKYKELRRKRKEEYMTYESEDSCRIIYEEIMKRLNSN